MSSVYFGGGATDVNARTHGSSALHEAAREGHANAVKLLLKKSGIKINARDNQGLTIYIHLASYLRHSCVIESLVKKRGVHVNAEFKLYGHTSLLLECINAELCRRGQTTTGNRNH